MSIAGHDKAPPLGEVIERLGSGAAQLKAFFAGGGVFLADGSEMLLITSVTRAVALEWDLEAYQRGTLVTVVFFGVFFGNLLSGTLGDRFGRRGVILLSYFGVFACSILSSFAGGFHSLCAARVLVGAAFGLGQPAWQGLGSELSPAGWRIFMTSGTQSFFTVGEIFSACLLIWDDPKMQSLQWRWLLRCGSLPSLLLLLLSACLLVESPSFLALAGRREEALAVLESIRRDNHADGVAVEFRNPEVPPRLSMIETWRRQVEVVFGARLLLSTFVVMYSCFILNLVYYGMMYAFPQVLPQVVAGSTAASEMLIGALWELPGTALGFVVGMSMARKSGIKVYLVATALSLTAFYVGCAPGNRSWSAKALLHMGYYGIKLFPNIGFVLVYQYSAELYPTEARITGTAVNLAGGRLAGMLAPLAFEMLTQATGDFRTFVAVLAAMTFLNALLVDCLRYETSGRQLKDRAGSEDQSDEEAIQARDLAAAGKDYGATGAPAARA